jgi:protein KTI12
MALVIICGQPCSGKSTAAACLSKALEKTTNMPVILIDEPSLNLDRNCAYHDMPREKNLRGTLRSAVDRAVSRDTIVIVDSLNNIKGYRYELWCLARASGTHYCVVFLKFLMHYDALHFTKQAYHTIA